MGNSTKALEKIKKIFAGKIEPRTIYLFGSPTYVTPKQHPGLELLITANLLEKRCERQIKVKRRLRGIHLSKDILVRTPEEIEKNKVNKYLRSKNVEPTEENVLVALDKINSFKNLSCYSSKVNRKALND